MYFQSVDELNEHVKNDHKENDGEYFCEKCSQSFSLARILDLHYSSEHSEQRQGLLYNWNGNRIGHNTITGASIGISQYRGGGAMVFTGRVPTNLKIIIDIIRCRI